MSHNQQLLSKTSKNTGSCLHHIDTPGEAKPSKPGSPRGDRQPLLENIGGEGWDRGQPQGRRGKWTTDGHGFVAGVVICGKSTERADQVRKKPSSRMQDKWEGTTVQVQQKMWHRHWWEECFDALAQCHQSLRGPGAL